MDLNTYSYFSSLFFRPFDGVPRGGENSAADAFARDVVSHAVGVTEKLAELHRVWPSLVNGLEEGLATSPNGRGPQRAE